MSGPRPLGRVTLLTHDLGRDPASLAALELGRWLRTTGGVTTLDTVSLWDGPRRDAFAGLGPVHVVNHQAVAPTPAGPDRLDLLAWSAIWHDRSPADVGRRFAAASAAAAAGLLRSAHQDRRADQVQGQLLRVLLAGGAEPVWVAGTTAARLLHYVPNGRTVVAHRPELDGPPASLDEPEDRAVLQRRPDAWIVGNETIRHEVERSASHEVAATVVPDVAFLPDAPVHRERSRARLLGHLGLGGDARLVGSLGEVDWWDVSDGFVQVAWEVCRRPEAEGVHFVWLAGASTERELWPLRHDLAHAGLGGRVHVVDDGAGPTLESLAALDVVLLSRRGRQGWPQLRQIEGVGVPIVRWRLPDDDDTGPAAGERATTLVDRLDERDAAAAILAVLDDPAATAAAHRRAAEVRADSGISRGGPHALAVLGAGGSGHW